jgi:4a-hydroxytetrahydrobiopterin dehydratase
MRMASDAVCREEDSALVRDHDFKDIAAAIAFVNPGADAAKEADHHPDSLVHGWNQVRPHSASGLTDNDGKMAERIDGLPLRPSP